MKKIIVKHIWLVLLAAWVYTLTFVFNNYWSQSSSLPSIAMSMQKRVVALQKSFENFYVDKANIQACLAFSTTAAPTNTVTDAGPFRYLFADGHDGLQLKYWSTSIIIPSIADISFHDTIRLVTYKNGLFILSVHHIPKSNLLAAQLTPVEWQYFISNDYLAEHISGIDNLANHIAISSNITDNAIRWQNGTPIFYIKQIGNQPIQAFNWPSFLLAVITTMLLVMFFHRVVTDVAWKYSFLAGLGMLFIGIAMIRLLLFFYNFPINCRQIKLFNAFDNGNYFWSHSIGDLFLNLLAAMWLFHFLRMQEPAWLNDFKKSSDKAQKRMAIIIITAYVCASFGAANIIKSLALHNGISFDVSNIFGLGWGTFFSIACLYFTLSIHYRILHATNKIFDVAWPQNKYLKFWIVAGASLFILTLFIKISDARLMIFVMLWALVCLVLEQFLPQHNTKKPVASNSFLFWMIWYAFSGMLLLVAQNTKRNEEVRMRVAHKQALQADAATESLLYQSVGNPLITEVSALLPQLTDKNIKKEKANSLIDEMQQKYFTGYLGGNQASFYIFDFAGNPIYQKDAASFLTLNTIYVQQALPTKHPNISYYDNSFENFSYIIKRTLYDDSAKSVGSLFITYTPTQFQKETLVPELFKQLQNSNPNFTGNYTYAVYKDGKLISINKDYPFQTALAAQDIPKQQMETKYNNGSEELWFNAGNGKTIVVVKTSTNFTDGITLFAYLFGIFILFQLIKNVLVNILAGKLRLKKIPSIAKLSIRNQIQSTILILCSVSFVITGIITVVFFTYRFRANNNSRLTKTIERVNNDMESQGNYNAVFNGQPIPEGQQETWNTSAIKKIAQSQNVDINLFKTNGDLVSTSQPIIYERGLISPKINPIAFYHLSVKKEVQFMQQERIGNLEYNSIYLPIRQAGGETKGYLNIPDFASQNELNQEISNFLIALINFFVFIFLLAGVITFIIANRITSSFELIGAKMKEVDFGKKNDPIDWQRNDEIGFLVAQYNRMIEQLDESAQKLAKSERENAWREMAKQVAHEIKNPLTPMKLSLQYLQRAIDNKSPDVTKLAEKVATNLVEQINHLAKIASDFSQFAQIDIAQIEELDLHDAIQQLVILYENNKQINISWVPTQSNIKIMADKTQINRLFTNIFQNAVEAREDDTVIALNITEKLSETQITICLSDNGQGIPTELRSKIFVPNFTTKSSGTGLGLAICKDIVEKVGGQIWFETTIGVGTDFFIKLPLMDRKTQG